MESQEPDKNAEIVASVRAALAEATKQLSPDIEPAPRYSPIADDDC